MKPGSWQTLFNFPGRLNSERWPGPVQAVICTLVAIKNVGVPVVGFSFHLTDCAIKSQCTTHESEIVYAQAKDVGFYLSLTTTPIVQAGKYKLVQRHVPDTRLKLIMSNMTTLQQMLKIIRLINFITILQAVH